MPLAKGSQPGGVVVAPPPAPGPVAPVVPDIGHYVPIWVAPDGTVLPLNPPGAVMLSHPDGTTTTLPGHLFSTPDVAGLGAVPFEVLTSPAADGGEVWEGSRAQRRVLAWPVRMWADTHLELLELWRIVEYLITQTNRLGPGQLRIRRQDGSERWIPALYSSGLEQEPEDGAWTQVTAPITLLCLDPWWRNATPVRRTWSQEPQPDYLDPYPNVSSGQVIGDAELRNDGHKDAWPTWTIRGPLTSLVATNVNRGESFTVTPSPALGVGDTVTVTTQPITARYGDGSSAIGALNLLAGGVPWRVDAKSTTRIQFTASGAEPETTPGAGDGTEITAEFYEKFGTA